MHDPARMSTLLLYLFVICFGIRNTIIKSPLKLIFVILIPAYVYCISTCIRISLLFHIRTHLNLQHVRSNTGAKIQSKLIWFYLKIWKFVDKPEFCDARLYRVAGSGVQDICSMKPRIRNANLLIIHVLDWCVKLLAMFHIFFIYKCLLRSNLSKRSKKH